MNLIVTAFGHITDAAKTSKQPRPFQTPAAPQLPLTYKHTPLSPSHGSGILSSYSRTVAIGHKSAVRLHCLLKFYVFAMASVASLFIRKVSSTVRHFCSEHITNVPIVLQRSHDQMECDSRQTPCNSHLREPSSQNTSAQPTPSLFNLNMPLSNRRGFDLRRPIMSQPRRDVIDLTEETSSPAPEPQTIPPATTSTRGANRPPRFDREIISVDDQDEDITNFREESPEIQFLRSEPLRAAGQSRSSSVFRSVQGRPRHTPGPRSLGLRPSPPVSVRVERATGQNHNQGWANTLNLPFSGHLNATLHRGGNDQLIHWEDFDGGIFQAPGDLDFFAPAFNYDNPSRPQAQAQAQAQLPTYDPPSPAKVGFTRSPNEDDTLVCPHCDDELGVGDNDVKRQVWVVKACGHVCFLHHTASTMLISP